jgi:FkbM family methyltransferase
LFNEALGALRDDGERTLFIVEKNRTGTPVYGPYVALAPGQYLACFRVAADPVDVSYTDAICCRVDVVVDSGRDVLAQTNIYASRLNGGEATVFLPFALASTEVVELRVHTTGKTRLYIDTERLISERIVEDSLYCPILPPGELPQNAFFTHHFEQFRSFHEWGFSVAVEDAGVVVTAAGLRFYVRGAEDFQLVWEVLEVNNYTLISDKPQIVIDVGMNIGLVSLLMAKRDAVLEVHGFEPFSTPVERALENFALNPALAPKITVNRCGLAGADDVRDVLVSDDATISTSIRGLDAGRSERIEVRDAATALRPIFERAEALGAEIFMKIDCEGSEFAIFESLARHGLLKRVRGFMVEWHKWWSADLTQKDLIGPLLANDFVVFDRTSPADLWAGQFNALRIAH